MTNQKFGGNALGLQRVLGLGGYQTAWSCLHKLRRRAMVSPGRNLLHGHVEVDETYIGGEEEGLSGRQIEKKAIVVVSVEVYEGEKALAASVCSRFQMSVEIASSDLFGKWFCPNRSS